MYFDEEPELCYVRHRYYSCDTGTFNSQDPIGLKGDMQLYAYVHDVNSCVDTMG
ncbi:RHS repeat-associated core domain protein [Prevotella disiens JCM 6334 = ATCC 29426]|uniref:RHS repeat-associated core domain protein n=2 Tax=Prevotella disiens TaxID=28130 RepID=A0ABN0NND9_9BACT|nr:RHS repeat-associated core domain protein [Prevotella disiens JCM 6334 = ATCC 29426]